MYENEEQQETASRIQNLKRFKELAKKAEQIKKQFLDNFTSAEDPKKDETSTQYMKRSVRKQISSNNDEGDEQFYLTLDESHQIPANYYQIQSAKIPNLEKHRGQYKCKSLKIWNGSEIENQRNVTKFMAEVKKKLIEQKAVDFRKIPITLDKLLYLSHIFKGNVDIITELINIQPKAFAYYFQGLLLC